MNKNIFSFKDGEKTVFMDPAVIERRWLEGGQQIDIETVLSKFSGPDFVRNIIDGVCCDENGKPLEHVTNEMMRHATNARIEAASELVPILYKMFELQPISRETGEGTTEDEILDIWDEYLEYVDGVKKNTEMTPNSPSSTLEMNSEQPIHQTTPNSQNMNESAVSVGTRNVL